MKAVNLVPADARRGRGGPNRIAASQINFREVRLAHAVTAMLVILVALVFLTVQANNDVKDKQATLAAVETQVTVEQAEAQKSATYISFAQAAQQREDQVREIAEQRFPWKRTLDQLSRVMPATTSLTSLNGSTTGLSSTSTSTAGTTSGGPTITLAGCADTPDQNGVATLLRRLRALSGVSSVGFQSSTRQTSCGNNFNLALSFSDLTSSATGATATTAVADSPATPATTTGSPTG